MALLVWVVGCRPPSTVLFAVWAVLLTVRRRGEFTLWIPYGLKGVWRISLEVLEVADWKPHGIVRSGCRVKYLTRRTFPCLFVYAKSTLHTSKNRTHCWILAGFASTVGPIGFAKPRYWENIRQPDAKRRRVVSASHKR